MMAQRGPSFSFMAVSVDGSGWQGVYQQLTKDGYTVSVVQNPTLSLARATPMPPGVSSTRKPSP